MPQRNASLFHVVKDGMWPIHSARFEAAPTVDVSSRCSKIVRMIQSEFALHSG